MGFAKSRRQGRRWDILSKYLIEYYQAYHFLICAITQVLPFIIPATYRFLLPPPSAYNHLDAPAEPGYTAVPSGLELDTSVTFTHPLNPSANTLSAADKWRLVKPLILRYMLPLCESSARRRLTLY